MLWSVHHQIACNCTLELVIIRQKKWWSEWRSLTASCDTENNWSLGSVIKARVIAFKSILTLQCLASKWCINSTVSMKIFFAFFSYNVCIGQPDDRKFFRKLSLQCLILDEGHMLKNMASQRYSYLMRIKVSFKWLTLSIDMQEICNFR